MIDTHSVFRSIRAMLLVILGCAAAASAQTTMDVLARQADAIVVGKVFGMKSEWTADRSRIVTRVTLGVSQYIKGKTATQSVTVVIPGGEIGEVGELYTHMPTFRTEENVVVFLEKATTGDYHVAGGNAGKVSIERDETSGRPVVGGHLPLEEYTRAVQHAVTVGSVK